MSAPQSYKNHSRFDPAFHFFLVPLFIANIVFTSIWYWHHRWQHAHSGPWAIVMSVALLLLLGLVRHYALKNQDRTIRLEERLRLASVVSAPELLELESLTTPQLIALRFASTAELPALARRAARENLDPKAIKAAITTWRADHQRI